MYGFTITKQGRKLLASLIAGQQLVILGVQDCALRGSHHHYTRAGQRQGLLHR